MEDSSNQSFNQNPESLPDEEWTSEKALNALVTERAVYPEEDPEATARRLFRENMPLVASRMIHTAIHDPNSATRVRAGMYVCDRVLGRVGEDLSEGDPLKDMLKDLADKVEEYANANSSNDTDTN
jgi:hypothetical protein